MLNLETGYHNGSFIDGASLSVMRELLFRGIFYRVAFNQADLQERSVFFMFPGL